MAPEAFRQRLRWALRESLLIAGIVAFWMGLGLLLLAALGIIAFVIQTFQLEQLRPVYEFTRQDRAVWAAVTPLASATTGLYVLVRAGTILLDRYQSTAGDR
jgi:hypothetical protein